jgi:hypothetical protein
MPKMEDLLTADDATLSNFLWNRRWHPCTMCGTTMDEGFCPDATCKTYPSNSGNTFLDRFKKAIQNTHEEFKREVSLNPKPSKIVSGGQVESKRRKY